MNGIEIDCTAITGREIAKKGFELADTRLVGTMINRIAFRTQSSAQTSQELSTYVVSRIAHLLRKSQHSKRPNKGSGTC